MKLRDTLSRRSLHPTDEHVQAVNEATSTVKTIVVISLSSAFLIFLVGAVICYVLYRRRNSDNTKLLLLKKNVPGEKILTFKKTTAVRSPGSAGLGPILKRSPTGQKTPPGSSEKDKGSQDCLKQSVTNKTSDVKQTALKTERKGYVELRDENKSKPEFSPENENVQLIEDNATLGTLHLKLKYNYEKQALCVTIIKCCNLPPKDSSSNSSDPYVKLQLLPDKQHKVKTRVLRKTLNPQYDEDFTFYGISFNQLQATTLYFVVLSFDRYSRDEVIGEIACQLNQLDFDAIEKQIYLTKDICPRSHKIRFQGRGEILVSLCYQPAATRITVVILKARNLPKMDITGHCDPYVKIYLLYNNQRITKKKTHVKKKTTNPVFNESFIFDVPYNEGLDNVSLEFQLLDYDRVTKNEVIGKMVLGSNVGGAAQKHWNSMVTNYRRQIAEWHKLE